MSQVRAATGDDNDRVDPARPLLELTGATVRFGEETALDAVDFRMFAGEVHSLMGENGAGKSTLIKALTGVYGIDAGTIKTVISFLGAEQAWMQIIVGGLLLLFILIQRFIVSRSERRE